MEVAMSECLIELREAGVQVSGKELLGGVNLCVTQGEHLAVIGPNGAGKSTLVKLLLGMHKASAGTVQIGGRDVASYPRRELARMIGYVPQLLAAEVPYTVREFVEMGRYAHGDRDAKAVDEAMELVEVSEFSERVVATLSGGERQRVCIAAALAQEAPLLLLDEPLAHLDPGQRIEVQRVLRGVREEVTLIAVTHDLGWMQRDFEHVLALQAGGVKFDGGVRDLMAGEVLGELFGSAVMDQLGRRLV
ncbi:iron(3+)-hydroxamate import ATP-binding protein FhuC [Rubritalea halochordaticola]|uniref:Iron(3+)-hydroxamate import ATP-binding protein FhuC n=2 Tax=Rubritalea halochordaticola TaxID=714537 RepID=A0ABP9UTP2_9BACT